jgi:hypothetical protein
MPKLNKTPDKQYILKQMYNGVVSLKFKKKDGEIREMNATLVTRLMEANQIKESNPNPPDGDSNLIVCWDVDKNAWRSFNVDTITEYTGLVGKA